MTIDKFKAALERWTQEEFKPEGVTHDQGAPNQPTAIAHIIAAGQQFGGKDGPSNAR